MVCSNFVATVYKEFLDMIIHGASMEYFYNYAKDNRTRPEIVLFSNMWMGMLLRSLIIKIIKVN